MTIKELKEQLAEFTDEERVVLVPSSRSDPSAYKEKFVEPHVVLRDDGVVLILPYSQVL